MRNNTPLKQVHNPGSCISSLDECPLRETPLQEVHNDPAGVEEHWTVMDKRELWGSICCSCTTLGLGRVAHADFGRHDDSHNKAKEANGAGKDLHNKQLDKERRVGCIS